MKYIDKDATIKALQAYRAGSVGFTWKHFTEAIHIVEGMDELDPVGDLLISHAEEGMKIEDRI